MKIPTIRQSDAGKRFSVAGIVAFGLLTSAAASAGETWIVRTDLWGNPAFSTLKLDRDKAQVSGDLDGDRVVGDAKANRISFHATDSDGRQSRYSATIVGDQLTGIVDAPDTNDPKARASHRFTAWRLPERPAGGARTL